MAKTRFAKRLKYALLATLVAIGAWLGLLFAAFMQKPEWAIQAYTTDIYPRVPTAFASGFLRWAPYDREAKVLDVQPILHFACSNYGLVGSDRDNSMQAVRILVSRGADINSRYNGLTPLHEAILYSGSSDGPELAALLLELGADPASRISRPGKEIDGKTAVEFAEFLALKHPGRVGRVARLMREAASSNSFQVTPDGAPQLNR